jgi:hypothetical protein
VIALMPFVLLGCGGSKHTTTVVVTATTTSSRSGPIITTVTGSSTAVTSTSAGAARVVHLDTFQSPSGNIGCAIIAGTARCDIKQRSWSPPPRPHTCPQIVDFGQGLIVGRSGSARLVCAGDTSLNPAAKTLAYNTDTVAEGFRCQSRSTGIVCRSTVSGHGFFISLEAYRVF